MVAPNGQLMISLTNLVVATPQPKSRWGQPSIVTSRCRCSICGLEDKADKPCTRVGIKIDQPAESAESVSASTNTSSVVQEWHSASSRLHGWNA
eukprot:932911-Amphidinium_carterae.1